MNEKTEAARRREADAMIRAAEGSRLPAGTLERALGKRREEWTGDDLVRLVHERGIRLVHLMHVGGDGWLKVLDFVPHSESHLRDILEGGERADGSSLFAGLTSGASDIVLRPRVESAFLDPFSEHPALVLLCRHVGRDGAPLPQSPDSIVRRAHARLGDEFGVDLWALGEVEYFLGQRMDDPEVHGSKDRGYHATAPFVFGEGLRREAMVLLAEMGVPVKYGHSEVGFIEARGETIWEQHEIELSLTPLPAAAEAVALTRWVVKNLAHGRRLRCSFDPMVMEGHPGNGLHFHLSPVVEGAHATEIDARGTLSEPAKWLIAGLARMGGTLMAFGNRDEKSFLRLRQGKEAPNTVVWGRYDRQALIRLPIVAPTESGRKTTPATIEFRLPDGSAQSHLLLAGIAQALAAGRDTEDLDGFLETTAAGAKRTAGKEAARVPGSAAQVAVALERQRALLEAGGVFPKGLIDWTLGAIKS